MAPALNQTTSAVDGELISDSGSEPISVDEKYAQENFMLQITGTQVGTEVITNIGDGPNEPYTECTDNSDGSRTCCTYNVAPNPVCNTTTQPGGGGDGRSTGDPLYEDCGERSRISTGEIMLTDHNDSFWSISDGGGDEERVGQIGVENIVRTTDGRFQATSFTRLTPIKYINRGQINDKDELWWGVELVTEWECKDGDRFFVAYDEDPNAETEFAPSFTMSAEVPIGGVPVRVGTTIGLGEVTIDSEDGVYFAQALPRDNFFELNRGGDRGCGTEPVPSHAADIFDQADYTKFCLEGSRDDGYLTLPDVYDR